MQMKTLQQLVEGIMFHVQCCECPSQEKQLELGLDLLSYCADRELTMESPEWLKYTKAVETKIADGTYAQNMECQIALFEIAYDKKLSASDPEITRLTALGDALKTEFAKLTLDPEVVQRETVLADDAAERLAKVE